MSPNGDQFVKSVQKKSNLEKTSDKRNDALKIAADVLRKRTTFEEGLLRAHAQKFVPEYIESLNMLSGSTNYTLGKAMAMIESGELGEQADKASRSADQESAEVTGESPGEIVQAEELIEQLDQDEGAKKESAKLSAQTLMAQAEFQHLQAEAVNLDQGLQECKQTIARLMAMSKEKLSMPPFWLNGVLFLGLAVAIAFGIWNTTQSLLWGMIIAVMGITTSMLSIIHDMAHTHRLRVAHENRLHENAKLLDAARYREGELIQRKERLLKRIRELQEVLSIDMAASPEPVS